MAPRRGVRERRREQLTRAAMRCIVRKGYDHVTLEDVCRAVGMSRGIASYYFENKEELLVSVLEKMLDDTTAAMKAFIDFSGETSDDSEIYEAFRAYLSHEDPVLVLRVGIKAVLQFVHRQRDSVFVGIEFMAQAQRNKAIEELYNYLNQRFWILGEMVISEGIKKGIFEERNPRSAAQMLLASGIGIILQSVTVKDFVSLEDQAEELTAWVLRYLQAPPPVKDGSQNSGVRSQEPEG